MKELGEHPEGEESPDADAQALRTVFAVVNEYKINQPSARVRAEHLMKGTGESSEAERRQLIEEHRDMLHIAMEPHRETMEAVGLAVRKEDLGDGEMVIINPEKFASCLGELSEEDVDTKLVEQLVIVAIDNFDAMSWECQRNFVKKNMLFRKQHPAIFHQGPESSYATDPDVLCKEGSRFAEEFVRLGASAESVQKIYDYGQCYAENTHEIAATLECHDLFDSNSIKSLCEYDSFEELDALITYLQQFQPDGYLHAVLGSSIDAGFVRYIDETVEAANASQALGDPLLRPYLEHLEQYRQYFSQRLGHSDLSLSSELPILPDTHPALPPEDIHVGSPLGTLHNSLTTIQYLQDGLEETTVIGEQLLRGVNPFLKNEFVPDHYIKYRFNWYEEVFLEKVRAQESTLAHLGLQVEQVPSFQPVQASYERNLIERMEIPRYSLFMKDGPRMAQTLAQIPEGALPAELKDIFTTAIDHLASTMRQWTYATNQGNLQVYGWRSIKLPLENPEAAGEVLQSVLTRGEEITQHLERLGIDQEACDKLRLLSYAQQEELHQELWLIDTYGGLWHSSKHTGLQKKGEKMIRKVVERIKQKHPDSKALPLIGRQLTRQIDTALAQIGTPQLLNEVAGKATEDIDQSDLQQMGSREKDEYAALLNRRILCLELFGDL